MPRVKSQHLRLPYVMRILYDETDEQHPVTAPELIKRLEKESITCDRKAIYRDIEFLSEEFGMDIILSRGEPRGYYVASRMFETTELQLLIDAVQSSRFISYKKSVALIDKISSLAGKYEAASLKKGLHMISLNKTENETVYYSMDTICDAMEKNKRVEFKYFNYDCNRKKVYRNDGEKYVVSPYALVWDDEKYYLQAYHEKYGRLSSFRVDLMENVRLSTLSRLKYEVYGGYDPSQRAERTFEQFTGEAVSVSVEFSKKLAQVVIDRFGKNVRMTPCADDRFIADFTVEISPMFLSWLFSFGDKAKVIRPQSVIDAMKDNLKTVSKMYSKL